MSATELDAQSMLADVLKAAEPGTSALFDPSEQVTVARAPGRLDLMGGIADYSGSLVLQWPIHEAAWVFLQRTPSLTVTVSSKARSASYAIPLADLETGSGAPAEYADVRAALARDPQSRWAAYVVGAFLVLMRERGVRFESGAKIMIVSDVPEGRGVGSSAAIEVATMQAVTAAYGVDISPFDLAVLCQMVENQVVGAPCGIMDQMTSACAESNSLLAILCQPAEVVGNITLPDGLAIWGLDSGGRHLVSGADYGTVRTAAFMGLALLERSSKRRVGGYLARFAPSEFAMSYAKIPKRMRGVEFQLELGQLDDPLSTVLPERYYPVRAATAHPIDEHFRIQMFVELLKGEITETRLLLLGELMHQSHESYSACGLGSPATDQLVGLVREAGPEHGLYGARVSGGGTGTVAILGRADASPAIEWIVERYTNESGYRPQIFSGSSPGAAAFGSRKVRLDGVVDGASE